MTGRIVFRDGAGRELTEADLAGATGQVRWEIVGGDAVPPEAQALHRRGRAAGERGEHAAALELLGRAQSLAPRWPYPTYDAAFTVLLQGDTGRAAELYEQVDRLAPRGFFTCRTTLDTLRRELRGELPPGFGRAFAQLEWMDDEDRKRAVLQGVVTQFPDFPPAWHELSKLLDDPARRMAALERGLASTPDPDTLGMLLLDKALLLHATGNRDAAVTILGSLALDPDSGLRTEALAKFALTRLD